ncbi:phosphoribosylformylglycinamidine synthase [Candidatus Gottesmanbacteria bacterium]|nr:phosphoribosylformylglycinamidine synthase [Candidatus Gottesmanbacteria bacterium]
MIKAPKRGNVLITSIEVVPNIADPRAEIRKRHIENLGLAQKISSLAISDIYTIEKSLDRKAIDQIVSLLVNPITQKATGKATLPQFDWIIEIGFLAGVTDNVAHTLKETIEDQLKIRFKDGEGTYSSQRTYLKGDLKRNDCESIAYSLGNPLIQSLHVYPYTDILNKSSFFLRIPKVLIRTVPSVSVVNLDVSDGELTNIGSLGIAEKDEVRRGPLALDLSSMRKIKKYFKKLGRNPTDIEIESLAQTWSEHCKHIIFSSEIDEVKEGLYKTYIKHATELVRKKKGKKDFCVSVFSDNSGAIRFDKNHLLTHKVETHNSPSALDPFGGAITGIVGVNRDAIGFGLGAKPVANTYGFCFAPPTVKRQIYRDKGKKHPMLPPQRILEGVVSGVNGGGNTSGIPTPSGFLYFDEDFQGKPLVFVGTVGFLPFKSGKKKLYEKRARSGDYIVMIGGRVGIDGIHGATFSSVPIDSNSPVSAVQIGDPITQKKFSDAIVKEARDLNLYNSITDNGAGGLSCSVAEMAKESGGCLVELEKVPLKYPNLSPWQIWISESQERMTLAVPPGKWRKFSQLCKSRGVEATIIGKFTRFRKCHVSYKGKTVMDIDLQFLHDGFPRKHLVTKKFNRVSLQSSVPKITDYTSAFVDMVGRWNTSSFEFISSQFDHEVQSTSVLKPLQGVGRVNSEATVFRPDLTSFRGVTLSYGLYPSYSELDSYRMAACCLDSAIRNVIAVGADPETIALLDNFCWCSSNERERLYQLKEAARACFDYAVSFQTPFISGKDSMFNDFVGFDTNGNKIKISIPPTLLISSVGIVSDISKTVSLDAKFPGDLIYILGSTNDELGGSEYFTYLKENHHNAIFHSSVPQVRAKEFRRLYKAYFHAIENNLIASAVSVTRGGLGVSLSKLSMAGKHGADISLEKLPGKWSRDDFGLFSESQGRILVAIDPNKRKQFEKQFKGFEIGFLGKVTSDDIVRIRNRQGKDLVVTSLSQLLNSYRKKFANY